MPSYLIENYYLPKSGIHFNESLHEVVAANEKDAKRLASTIDGKKPVYSIITKQDGNNRTKGTPTCPAH